MVKKYIGILRHPGFNGDFTDDVLGIDDSGGIVGSAGNIADDVLGLDPNGGGIYDIPVIGDIAEELVVGPVGAVVSVVVPPLAVVRAAQALSVAHDTGKGSLAAVAQAAMAAYGVATAPTVPVDIGAGITVPVNANVVAATEMALAEGYTAEQVAKTLIGFGDKATTQAVLQQAGYPAAQSSWAAMTAETAAATDSAAITNMSPEQLSNLQTAVDSGDAAAATQQLSSAGIASPLNQDVIQSNLDYVDPVAVSNATGMPVEDVINQYYPPTGEFQPTTLEDIVSGTSAPNAAQSQVQMLADQYRGFSEADIVQHMAGSSIDPVLAEEIMGNLGYDPFMVSDYMDANPTSFGNTYADPSFLDKLKSGLKTAKTLQGLLGSSGGGTGGTGSPNVNKNYSQLMSQLDPYWDYRKNTEIPLMGAAAGAAGQLSGLYQQSFTNPLGVYNTPEMQATNAAFMDEMQRRDAASGRLSQYGARGVEAQNKFLTNTLPTYRTNLQQGLGTLYQAARPQASDSQATASAMGQASLLSAANAANQQGTIAGSVGNLQNSWNQMTGSNNVFDQISGVVNTASNVADLYTKGSQAWDTLSNLF